MSRSSRNLDSWLDDFPTEEVETELDSLEEEAGRIAREIRKRRRLLDARNMFLGLTEDVDGQVRIANGSARRALESRSLRDRVAIAEAHTPPPQLSRAARLAGTALTEAAAMTTEASSERITGSEIAKTSPDDVPAPDLDSPRHLSRAGKLMWFLKRYRGETWKLSDIRDRLVQEGYLDDSPGETHGLQVTASRLYRTGHLERPEAGHYLLPADDNQGED